MARIAPLDSVKIQTDRNIHVVENAAIALYDAKSELVSTYEEFMIILTVGLLIVSILNMENTIATMEERL